MFTPISVNILSGLNTSLDGLATTAEGLSVAENADFSLPGEVTSREAVVQLTDAVITRVGNTLVSGVETLSDIAPTGCASHAGIPLMYKPGAMYSRKGTTVYGAGPFWSVTDTVGHAAGGSQAQRMEAVNVTPSIVGYTSGLVPAWYTAHDGVYPKDTTGTPPAVFASCASRNAVFFVSGSDVKMKFGFPNTTTVTLASNFAGGDRGIWAVDCTTYTLLAYSTLTTVVLMRVSDTGTVIASAALPKGPLTSGALSIGLGYNGLTGVAVLIASTTSSAQLLVVSFTASTLTTLVTATPTATYGAGVRDCAVGCCGALSIQDRWRALVCGGNGYLEVYSFPENDPADFNTQQELPPVDLGAGKYDAWSILCQPTPLGDRLVFGAINHRTVITAGPVSTPIQLGTWVILDTKLLAIVAAGDEGTCAVTLQGSSSAVNPVSLVFGVAEGSVFNNGVVTHTRAVPVKLECTGATTAVANSLTYFSGKTGYCFDGDSCFPAGFPIRPAGRVVAGTGGSLAAGDYSVQTVWKFIDGAGNAHESAPSDKVTLSVASSGSLTLTNTLPTGYYGAVWLDVYIAGPNPSQNSGLYRVSTTAVSLAPVVITAIPGGVLNALPPLYTNGGILENNVPSASRGIISAGKRLWSSDGKRVLASKLVSYSKGIAWSYLADDSLVITPPPSAGQVRGMGAIDDIVLLFCENSVLLVSGSGPSDVGGTSDFDTPREVYRAPGPRLPTGVCGTPTGVVWSSAGGGIHVVNAAGQGSSIGQAVGGEWGRICYLPEVLDQTSNRLRSARLLILSLDNARTAVFCLASGAWSVYLSEYITNDICVSSGVCYFTQLGADFCWAHYDAGARHGQFTLTTLLRDLVFDSRVHSVSPTGLLRSGVGSIEVSLFVDEARRLVASKVISLNVNNPQPPRTGLFKWVPSVPHLTSYMLKLAVEGDVRLSGLIVETQSSGVQARKDR